MITDDDPKTIIQGLKVSHQMLVESILQIQLSLRAYNQAKPKLRDLYKTLQNHFGREDAGFYDRLSLYYADDRQSTKMLEFLVHDLKDLKIRYLVFYDLHSAEMSGGHPRTFPLDFTEFSQSILSRIKMEEDYLFPLLEKMPNQGSR
jgi:hypothetical protein